MIGVVGSIAHKRDVIELFHIFWIDHVFLFDCRSERVGKTNVGGTLLTEAKYINLSLHYLEQVKIVA